LKKQNTTSTKATPGSWIESSEKKYKEYILISIQDL
jgi:hypothetical protein